MPHAYRLCFTAPQILGFLTLLRLQWITYVAPVITLIQYMFTFSNICLSVLIFTAWLTGMTHARKRDLVNFLPSQHRHSSCLLPLLFMQTLRCASWNTPWWHHRVHVTYRMSHTACDWLLIMSNSPRGRCIIELQHPTGDLCLCDDVAAENQSLMDLL